MPEKFPVLHFSIYNILPHLDIVSFFVVVRAVVLQISHVTWAEYGGLQHGQIPVLVHGLGLYVVNLPSLLTLLKFDLDFF